MSPLFVTILWAILTCARAQTQASSQASLSDPRGIARKLLEDATHDRNPDVRKDAAEAMSLMKADDRVFLALESMLDDSDVIVRITAVNALGNVKDKKVLPLLEKALHDPTPEVDFAAAKALFQLHDPRGKQFLLEV